MSSPTITDVPLTEAEARQVLLVQAVESAPDSAAWSAEDRHWASRAATQALGADAPRARWLVERARLAMQRMGARDAAVRQLDAHALWRPTWQSAALGLGLLAGLVSDALLAGAYFNLLSLPFFGLLAWNLVLYAWMAARTWAGPSRAGLVQQGLARGLTRWLRRAASTSSTADFAQRWLALSRPLITARVVGLMHLAAAALALGLLAGMYARALVYDYRAGWATTLLEPGQVHAVLSTVFAPAQWISGIELPEIGAVAALQVIPPATASASAAPWLHLMAITLVWVVLLPRMGLAALAARRARHLTTHFPLPLTGVYFDRLRAPASLKGLALTVLPHGQAVSAQTATGLKDWVARALSAQVPLAVAEPVRYGDEEGAGVRPAPPGRLLLLFDLTATPEDEVHGQLARALSGHPLLVVDEAEFVRRFGSGARLAERRSVWTAFARAFELPLLLVDLSAPDDASAEQLRRVLET